MEYTLYVSILLLAGLAGGTLAKKLKLPSVTGYILSGLLLGPSFMNLITGEVYNNLGFVNELALGILAISVGTELHRDVIKRLGHDLAFLSIGNTFFTMGLVTLITYWMGMPLPYALVLGSLGMTVSPSGVVSMIKEKRAKGPMTQTILGMVAFDNLITILVFGVVIALVEAAESAVAASASTVLLVFLDVFLALTLGAVIGFIVAYFIRREVGNDQLLVILLAAILAAIGISNTFNLSPILTNIVLGAVITNLTNRKVLVARVINRVELPIFVIFLTLAGAHLDLAIVRTVGLIGVAYITGRFLGKYLGTFIFSHFTQLDASARKNIGFALIPQAGVAIGLATIAERSLPGASGSITGVVLTGVVFFEIVGPLLLDKALTAVNEAAQL